jgi:hypothetical protein
MKVSKSLTEPLPCTRWLTLGWTRGTRRQPMWVAVPKYPVASRSLAREASPDILTDARRAIRYTSKLRTVLASSPGQAWIPDRDGRSPKMLFARWCARGACA